MFFGREKELELLNKLYQSNEFSLLVMYGRRRVGKTSLLQEFSKTHKTLFFSAQEQNNSLNIRKFTELVKNYFSCSYNLIFEDWSSIFDYLSSQITNEKLVLIIDEFPFIAKECPEIKSILQHIIDHKWKNSNLMLILCGSSVSFMVNEVMGYNSPLYGRRTHSIEIKPFDYTITKQFYPNMNNTDRLLCYGILGGIPLYLNMFKDSKYLKENIIDSILSYGCYLFNEPMNLLRMELREPIFYNSILSAIATGATRLNDIANKTKEDSAKCSKYIDNLREIRIVEKKIPCGEPATSKKGIYRLTDNFYKFWYKYIFSSQTEIELIGQENFADLLLNDINNYMGLVFEEICTQYMLNHSKELPFIPKQIGKWWGNNSIKKKQDDVDILLLNDNKAIFCECKFRNQLFDLKELNDLIDISELFTEIDEKYYYIFSKSGFTKAVIDIAKEKNVKLITPNEMF